MFKWTLIFSLLTLANYASASLDPLGGGNIL